MSTLSSRAIPLVHVVLDLGHDVLRALHCHRDPPQVRYLDLLLKGLRHKGLLVLLSTFSPRMSSCTRATSSQSRPRGKTLVGRLLRLSFLKGVEALDLCGRVEVVSWVALGQGSKERSVTRTARDQRPVIAEPARRLSTSVTYHLAIVLAEI